jgi:hypothetical protein
VPLIPAKYAASNSALLPAEPSAMMPPLLTRYHRSATERARRACCSTRRTASPPRSAASRMAVSNRPTIRGARPSDSSSTSSALGSAASARASVSICCSPPESKPPRRRSSGSSSGKCRNAPSMPPRPSFRLSRVDKSEITDRSSGMYDRPPRARRCSGAERGWPRQNTWPAIGESRPTAARRVVVLPAPLGPKSATTSPGQTFSDTSRMAERSPYPAVTRSSARTGSLEPGRRRTFTALGRSHAKT